MQEIKLKMYGGEYLDPCVDCVPPNVEIKLMPLMFDKKLA